MKKFLLALFSTAAINSFAQPAITASGINPVLGDVISANGANWVAPGNAGANQTWDLSAMTSSGTSSSTYIAASTTPNASSFPSSNLAINTGSGSYVYYKTSGAAWQNCGSVTSTTMSYSDLEDIIRFPFTYNNSYVDTWSSVFISGGVTFYRTGIDSVTADSYGTLITPNGTYTNVLRVHFKQDYQDSADFGGPLLLYYHNDEYMWYLNGNHNPIAAVYALTGDAGNISAGNYMNNVMGVEEKPNSLVSFSVFPNPATEKLNFKIELSEKENVELKIFNTAGDLVQTPVSTEGLPGENEFKISVRNLPEGIYFAEMILNGTPSSTIRFTVSK